MVDHDDDPVSLVAHRIYAQLDDLVAAMDDAEVELAPGLITDRAIAAEFSASNRANVRHVLDAVLAGDHAALTAPPPEAYDIIRTVVRRGIEIEAIFQAYRRGQNVVWRHFMATAADLDLSTGELAALFERFADILFTYVDTVLAVLLDEAQRVREELLGGAPARRAETVRLILDGAPVDEQTASARLGYDLAGEHTALVVWLDGGDGDDGVLESTFTTLEQATRSGRGTATLTIAASARTLWGWLPGKATALMVDAGQHAVTGSSRGVRVAVGPTLRGLAGFRASHLAARDVAELIGDDVDGDRVVHVGDVASVLLAAHDVHAAARFVGDVLGRLAVRGERESRLRTTLRVYLDEAENAPRTATRLHTHRNTVLQRVDRAAELLGHPPGERRLAVTLALDIAHYLGEAVLVGGGASGPDRTKKSPTSAAEAP